MFDCLCPQANIGRSKLAGRAQVTQAAPTATLSLHCTTTRLLGSFIMPPKKKSGRDDLTIDGTAKLGNVQASQERSTINQPHHSHARPTTAPTPYGVKLNTYPPQSLWWNRGVYDPTQKGTFRLAHLVASDRLPLRFANYGAWPDCQTLVAEPLWRCRSLHKNVPWDVCLAACSAYNLKWAAARGPVRFGLADMPDVAHQMKVSWMVSWIVKNRLVAFVKRRMEEHMEAAHALLQLKFAAQVQTIDRQAVQSTAPTNLGMISSRGDETSSAHGPEDAVTDFTSLSTPSRKRVRQPATRAASMKEASALPPTPRSGAAKRGHQSRSMVTKSHDETDSDGQPKGEDDGFKPPPKKRLRHPTVKAASGIEAPALPPAPHSGPTKRGSQSISTVSRHRELTYSDSEPEDKDDDFSPSPNKRVVRPTPKAASKRKSPAVRPESGAGIQQRVRHSSATPSAKQFKAGPSRPVKSLYSCSCAVDSHDPADLKCGFRWDKDWTDEERDKLCFLKGNLDLQWAAVGRVLGREDSVRQCWLSDRPVRKAYNAGLFPQKPLWTVEDTDSVVKKHRTGIKWSLIGAALEPRRSELECQMQYRQWLLIRTKGLKEAEPSSSSMSTSTCLSKSTGGPSHQSTPATVNNGSHSGNGMTTPSAAQPHATPRTTMLATKRGKVACDAHRSQTERCMSCQTDEYLGQYY